VASGFAQTNDVSSNGRTSELTVVHQKKSPCRRFVICKKKTCAFAPLRYFVKFRGFVCGVCSSSRCVWGLETLAVLALKTVNCRLVYDAHSAGYKMYQRFYWTFFCCEVWGTSFILNVGANASYTALHDTINSNNLHMICLRSLFLEPQLRVPSSLCNASGLERTGSPA